MKTNLSKFKMARSAALAWALGFALTPTAPGFAFQTSSEPWKLTGCLRDMSGRYLLTDEITNVTVEVAGPGLARESGNRVEVTGSADPAKPPISPATHYIRVSRVKRLSRNCAPAEKEAPGRAGNSPSHTGSFNEIELRP